MAMQLITNVEDTRESLEAGETVYTTVGYLVPTGTTAEQIIEAERGESDEEPWIDTVSIDVTEDATAWAAGLASALATSGWRLAGDIVSDGQWVSVPVTPAA
jgi:hypothetical protein